MFKKLFFLLLTSIAIIACTKEIDPEAIKECEEGIELIKKFDFMEAVDHLNKAIEIDSTYSESYYQLGYIYTIRYHEDEEMPIKYFKKAIKHDPNVPKYYDQLITQIAVITKNEEEVKKYAILGAKIGAELCLEFCKDEGLNWRDE